MTLTRDQILKAVDTHAEAVEVPEWNGTVHIRSMSLRERLEFEGRFKADRAQIVPVLLAFTLADDAGERLFSEADIEALQTRDALVLLRLFKVAMKVNDLEPEDVKALEGNSTASRTNGLHSVSPQ